MSVRQAICGCRYKPSRNGGIVVVLRCRQHQARDLPRGAPHIESIAASLTLDMIEPEYAAKELDELCAERDDYERAEALEYFEDVLGIHSFDRLLDPRG